MNNAAVLRMRFPGMTESIGPMCDSSANPWGASRFPMGPLPGSGARREDRARLIVHDEFRPAIPRRVARQQGPLLFHRQIQLKSIAVLNGIIYHRTVNCLLTFCLTHRSNPKISLQKLLTLELLEGRGNYSESELGSTLV